MKWLTGKYTSLFNIKQIIQKYKQWYRDTSKFLWPNKFLQTKCFMYEIWIIWPEVSNVNKSGLITLTFIYIAVTFRHTLQLWQHQIRQEEINNNLKICIISDKCKNLHIDTNEKYIKHEICSNSLWKKYLKKHLILTFMKLIYPPHLPNHIFNKPMKKYIVLPCLQYNLCVFLFQTNITAVTTCIWRKGSVNTSSYQIYWL